MLRPDDLRILILAPTSNDARLTSAFLTEKGFATAICKGLDDLRAEMEIGCGALLLAEEGLASGDVGRLVVHLERQPSWSDLPLILITTAGDSASVRPRHLAALAPVGNISVIERPVRPETLISTCEVALRARRRQYQVSDLLLERETLLARVVEQSRIFDTTLSSIPDFAYIFDRQGRFVYANKALLKFLQVELPDLVGKTFEDLGRPRDRATRLRGQINHVFETGEPVRDESPYITPTGTTNYYEYIFAPVFAEDGAVTVVAGSTRDVSERHRTEEALREADRRKDEFLAMLAHELRNPLAAVTNAAAVIASKDEHDRAWAAEVITRQSAQLAHLIDDLLDVSRITTGKVRLRKQLVDAATVLDRARDSAASTVKSRGHELICSYSAGFLWVDADPTRLEQVVINLLMNAAKYTPASGRIELAAKRTGNDVLISVKDNGIGIPPDRIAEMFELFVQGERSIARSEGGLGIGLTIAQKLVEMHDGRIEAQSDGANCGSTFRVLLPAAQAPRSQQPELPGDASSQSRRRILIVDDNVDTARGLARLLTREGHETALAHDGLHALQKAREWSPQAILLDIGLPGMDGFDVAHRLRQEKDVANAVIIAVTGYGQPEDRQRAIAAGFNHHLVKPVDFAQLKMLLQKPYLD